LALADHASGSTFATMIRKLLRDIAAAIRLRFARMIAQQMLFQTYDSPTGAANTKL